MIDGKSAATSRAAGLRVLFVTFPFPPMRGSSGVQRPTKFAKYLSEWGATVDVLTAHPRAYEQSDPSSTGPALRGSIRRATAFDAARHFSIAGRYPRLLATPDRWASWIPFATKAGRRMIAAHRPHVIWSTSPIASAHVIARRLARTASLPWVADFRDPLFEEEFEDTGARRARVLREIDEDTVRTASLCVFTTSGTRDLYAARYPDLDAAKLLVIENGFDEEDFVDADVTQHSTVPIRPFTLLHSGTIYSFERDPKPLFTALGRLRASADFAADRFRLRLRAPGDARYIEALIREFGCQDVVEILPAVSHREAIREMLSSNGLLLLQADNCNRQIPAKAYEYLRTGRPILALTDSRGDTAGLLSRFPGTRICPLADAIQIEAALKGFVDEARRQGTVRREREGMETLSRRGQAALLAERLVRFR